MDGLHVEVSGGSVIPGVSPCSHERSKSEILLSLEPAPLRGKGETMPCFKLRSYVGQAHTDVGLIYA